MDKYEELLERAIDQLPPEVFEHKRFKIPKAYSDIQGNRTFLKLIQISKVIEHSLKTLKMLQKV